ncbi:MAG: ABC transporter ATP-binding protein [Proteobacteria bacterium]|nr:ABC transporter ATP-binding protein [Pseudomonadota bacterium]
MLKIDSVYLRIGGSSILNGVNFEVQAGEKVGLIGPNGSGKTTLFNCISGFNSLTLGKILFKGEDISKLSPSARAHKGLGRVFQNFGVFREMTLMENMLVAFESKQKLNFLPWSKDTKKNKASALEFLSLVKLEAKADSKASSLSGGQMRLLEIARALAFGSDLLLLDEPTAGVSPKMKLEIETTLLKLQELKKTYIVIEHDINFIQRICDRVLVLDQGKVELDNTPELVRADSKLQDIYFGVA